MSDKEAQPGTNSLAGNTGAQPEAANTKMGIDVQNTNANNPAQPATIDAGLPTGAAPAATGPNAAVPPDPATVTGAAAPTDPHQPDSYGGNFGNDVQGSYNDPNRASNQASAPDRGAFGQQQYNQGSTHGGYGNQYREFDTAAERPAAEANEEKYYGEGASRPGPQHNSYRAYDSHDLVPDQQGHAVPDSAPVAAQHPSAGPSPQAPPTDNRNLPGRDDKAAAFQNDNGSPTVGPAYAADYGHTSGVALPAGTPSHHLPLGPDGHGLDSEPASPRGSYDGTPPSDASQGAPAPVNAPDAPQTEGYGYGHERSEDAQPGNPHTGDSRNGFGPGGSQEGSVSQGHGSQGGSYDDENPGARGPGHDQFTQQDKAQNYGQEQRENFRPADDHPTEGDHGPTPRRNAGRDENNG